MKFTTLTETDVPVVSITVKCSKCKQFVTLKKENTRCACGAMMKYVRVERRFTDEYH